MAKLFLFAIGGTGSRVVKALTMLLASGVEIQDTDCIIPIIIDPDSANGDLSRTVDILKKYKEIRNKTFSEKSNFFKTQISTLDELGDNGYVSDTFKFEIDGVKDQLFSEFIGFNELNDSNKAFLSVLFSKSNLDADMEVGFKGNPNIGSVVLNSFKNSPFFQKFSSHFEKEDRIFIISSIFGGTGAAGFPLILKNIRDAKPPLAHHSFLQDSKIGAVTILPYFEVEKNENTTIDSNTFISKTKAALSYYSRNVSGNKSINALYYIGDKLTNQQTGADGANLQRNKAHFVELAAALSIIDFMSLQDVELQTEKGEAIDPKYFEFGLNNETNSISFKDLAKETQQLISKPITQYSLFKIFMESHYAEYSDSQSEAWANHGNNKLSKNFIDKRLLPNILDFNKHYGEWISEMSDSNISFSPINLSKSGKDIYNLVNFFPVTRGFLTNVINGTGLNNYRGLLNRAEPELDFLDSNKKLSAVFFEATKVIVDKEIKL